MGVVWTLVEESLGPVVHATGFRHLDLSIGRVSFVVALREENDDLLSERIRLILCDPATQTQHEMLAMGLDQEALTPASACDQEVSEPLLSCRMEMQLRLFQDDQ